MNNNETEAKIQKSVDMQLGGERVNFTPKNRAERRMLAKKQKQAQKKQMALIQKYITKHPEAIEIKLDEEAIKTAQAQENAQENEEYVIIEE